MISTIVRIGYLNLKNGDSEIVITLAVPLVFFSIFALIFDNGIGGGATGKVKVVLVDEDDSKASRKLIAAIGKDSALRVMKGEKKADNADSVRLVDYGLANQDVGNGLVKAAIVIPKGWDESHAGESQRSLAVQILSDTFDPVAKQIVFSVVKNHSIQSAVARKSRLSVPPAGLELSNRKLSKSSPNSTIGIERTGVGNTNENKLRLRADEVQRSSPKTQGNEGAAVRNQRPTGNLNSKDKNESKQKYDSQQKYTVDKGTKHRVRKPGLDSKLLPAAINDGGVNDDKTTESSWLEGEKESSIGLDANVEEIDLVGGKKSNPILSSYASGIVVVFVLFSATGFAGTLLDENETQTLERILNGRINMTQLLAGKWIFIFAIGVLQVFCMFVWAMLYGIDFTSNFAGFFLITIGTVAASTSFAMLLATMCRTRGQLNTVSMVVILTMSAMGGSMVPRYIMSETMQQIGRFTFNAWALDGYNKVFWYGSPVAALQTEMIVLFGAAIVLFAAARWFAIRWERVA